MFIKSLDIKNFMRIRDAHIDFDGRDVIGILAEHATLKDRSNFIGKTNLIESIRYALTGNSRASKEINLIHYGEELMTVTVVLEHEGKEYKVTRSRDIKNNGQLTVNWVQKTSDAQAEINNLLGIQPHEFDHIFFFKQQDFHSFLELTPDKKKQLLMSWFKNDHWRDKEDKVTNTIKEKQKQLSQVQFKISDLEQSLNEVSLENNKAVLETDLRKIKIEIKSLEQKNKELLQKSNFGGIDFEKLLTRKSKLEFELEEKKETGEQLATKREEHTELVNELKELTKKIDGKSEESIRENAQKLKDYITKKSVERTALANKLNILLNTKSGICPILSETCDRITATPQQTKAIQNEIGKINNEVSGTNEKIQKYNDYLLLFDKRNVKLNQIERCTNKIESLKNSIGQFTLFENELKQIDEQLKLAPSKEQRDQLKALQYELNTKRDILVSIESKLAVIEHKRIELEKNRALLDSLRIQLLELNDELNDLKFLAFMFGRNGIPSLEIENAFSDIEADINAILEEITDGISVSFSPTRELSAWEDNCLSCGYLYPKGYRKNDCEKCGTKRFKKRKDELRILIVDKGNEIEFEMCSGGLKTLISLALRLSFSVLLRRQFHTSLDVLFLDEIDSAMDKYHKDMLKKLITDVLVKKLNFKQIFWISHDKTISDSVPHILKVKANSVWSSVSWQ